VGDLGGKGKLKRKELKKNRREDTIYYVRHVGGEELLEGCKG